MKRPFRTFLGVDLGGGKGKNTAVVRLALRDGHLWVEEALTRLGESPLYDDVLVPYLLEHAPQAVLAIDAPLTLPACIRCPSAACPGMEHCSDPTVAWFRRIAASAVPERTAASRKGKPTFTPYTQRATEVVLQRANSDIVPRETLGQGMGPLTARACYLVRALAPSYSLGKNLIEVYPRATLHQLFGKRYARGYKRQTAAERVRLEIIERIAQTDALRFATRPRNWPEFCDQTDHLFDALICAYTAYLWARDGWTLPEEDAQVFTEDGWIFMPPKRGT